MKNSLNTRIVTKKFARYENCLDCLDYLKIILENILKLVNNWPKQFFLI